MTRISKVLVVFTTAACLAFLGFAAAVVVGGPNWQRITEDELPEYVFERSVGENPTWSAKLRGEDQAIATDPTFSKVVVAALEHKKRTLETKINGDPTKNEPPLDQQISVTQGRIEEARELAKKDRAALDRYAERLAQQLEQLNNQIAQVSQQIVQKTQEAEAVQSETDERRGDVIRLREQLEALEEDRDRVMAQQEQLRDRIARLEGTRARLERRKEQLERQAEPAKPAAAENETI